MSMALNGIKNKKANEIRWDTPSMPSNEPRRFEGFSSTFPLTMERPLNRQPAVLLAQGDVSSFRLDANNETQRDFISKKIVPWLEQQQRSPLEDPDTLRSLQNDLWTTNLLHDQLSLQTDFDPDFIARLKKALTLFQNEVFPISDDAIRTLTAPQGPAQSAPTLADLHLHEETFLNFMGLTFRGEVKDFVVTQEQYESLTGVNLATLTPSADLEYGILLARLTRAAKKDFFRAQQRTKEETSHELGIKIVHVVSTWVDSLKQDITPEEATRLIFMIQSVWDNPSAREDITSLLSKREVRQRVTSDVEKIYSTYLSPLSADLYNSLTEPVIGAKEANAIADEQRKDLQSRMLDDLNNPFIPRSLLAPFIDQLPSAPLVPTVVTKSLLAALLKLYPASDKNDLPLRDRIIGYGYFNAFRFAFVDQWNFVLEKYGYTVDEGNRALIDEFQKKERAALDTVVESWKLAHTPLLDGERPRPLAKSRPNETAPLVARLKLAQDITGLQKKWAKQKREGTEEGNLASQISRMQLNYLAMAGVPAAQTTAATMESDYERILKSDQIDAALMPALIGEGLSFALITPFIKAAQESERQDQTVWIGKKALDNALGNSDTNISKEQKRRLCKAILELEEKRKATLAKEAAQKPKLAGMFSFVTSQEGPVLGFNWESAVVGIRFTDELLEIAKKTASGAL